MNRLRELRQKLGCSQAEMAESVGVKQNTWSQWECYLPETLLVMQRLGKKYDVSIDYLLELTDNPKRADAGGSATGDSPIAATETIAKRIRQAREAAGMSQTEAGAAVGLSQSQYSLIERDRSGLTVTRLMKLATAFGVSPAWLMAETDEL